MAGGVGGAEVAVIEAGACLGEREPRDFSEGAHAHDGEREAGFLMGEKFEQGGKVAGAMGHGGDFEDIGAGVAGAAGEVAEFRGGGGMGKIVVGEDDAGAGIAGAADDVVHGGGAAQLDIDKGGHGDEVAVDGAAFAGGQRRAALRGMADGDDAGAGEPGADAAEGVEFWEKAVEAEFEPVALALAQPAGGGEGSGGMDSADNRRI